MNPSQQAVLSVVARSANLTADILTATAWWLRCRATALQPIRLEDLLPGCSCHRAWHLVGQFCPTDRLRT